MRYPCTLDTRDSSASSAPLQQDKKFVIDNLLVRIHFIIEMIWWTGLAPWEFEFPFPGSLISTFPAGGALVDVIIVWGLVRTPPNFQNTPQAQAKKNLLFGSGNDSYAPTDPES